MPSTLMSSKRVYLITIDYKTHTPIGGCVLQKCVLYLGIFDNDWLCMKQNAPSEDGAFIERTMVLFSSRGREIRTPDLLLPKQDGLA